MQTAVTEVSIHSYYISKRVSFNWKGRRSR